MKRMTLRTARKARKLTQQRLAALAGVRQGHISSIERNRVVDPQNSTVAALEDALGLQRGTLVFGAQERVSA